MLKYKTAPKCSLSGPFRHSGVGRNPGAVGPVRSYNLNFTYPCQRPRGNDGRQAGMKEGFVEALVLRARSGRAWRRFVEILPPGLRFLPPVIPSLPCSPLVLAPFLAPLVAPLPQVAPPDKRVSYHAQHLYCDNCKPCRKYNGSAGVAHYGRKGCVEALVLRVMILFPANVPSAKKLSQNLSQHPTRHSRAGGNLQASVSDLGKSARLIGFEIVSKHRHNSEHQEIPAMPP